MLDRICLSTKHEKDHTRLLPNQISQATDKEKIRKAAEEKRHGVYREEQR